MVGANFYFYITLYRYIKYYHFGEMGKVYESLPFIKVYQVEGTPIPLFSGLTPFKISSFIDLMYYVLIPLSDLSNFILPKCG